MTTYNQAVTTEVSSHERSSDSRNRCGNACSYRVKRLPQSHTAGSNAGRLLGAGLVDGAVS